MRGWHESGTLLSLPCGARIPRDERGDTGSHAPAFGRGVLGGFHGLRWRRTLSGRLWEIDFARGVAIVMMVTYHLLFDLDYLGLARIPVDSGFLLAFARLTASTFIALAGVSSVISFSRGTEANPMSADEVRRRTTRRFARRGLSLFGWGMVITAVTYLAVGREAVCFGILHFIGTSVILAPFFIPLGLLNLLIGPLLVWLGISLSEIKVNFPWLFWLGLKTAEFRSLDYFPMLPWFGVFLLGLGAGTALYRKRAKRPLGGSSSASGSPPPGRTPARGVVLRGVVSPLVLAGRNSLLIYLAHQPLILGLLSAVRLFV